MSYALRNLHTLTLREPDGAQESRSRQKTEQNKKRHLHKIALKCKQSHENGWYLAGGMSHVAETSVTTTRTSPHPDTTIPAIGTIIFALEMELVFVTSNVYPQTLTAGGGDKWHLTFSLSIQFGI